MSGLMQYSMTGDKNAIWRGALMGMGMGAAIGGISGGIQAKMNGGRFWDGAKVEKLASVTQNIPQVGQDPKECLFANIKATDQSFGGNLTDNEIRSLIKWDAETGYAYTSESWANYAEYTGRTVTDFTGRPAEAIAQFRDGARVSINLHQEGDIGHSVMLRSYQDVTITRVNGFQYSNPNLRIMNPAGSGWGWSRLQWLNYLNTGNQIFVIY